jgi:hypothetical protein
MKLLSYSAILLKTPGLPPDVASGLLRRSSCARVHPKRARLYSLPTPSDNGGPRLLLPKAATSARGLYVNDGGPYEPKARSLKLWEGELNRKTRTISLRVKHTDKKPRTVKLKLVERTERIKVPYVVSEMKENQSSRKRSRDASWGPLRPF